MSDDDCDEVELVSSSEDGNQVLLAGIKVAVKRKF